MSDKLIKSSGFGVGEAGQVPASSSLDEIKSYQLQPTRRERMVKCDCGHTVPISQMMNASMGTSCPDCYDEMSD